jgi:hypothetical protein
MGSSPPARSPTPSEQLPGRHWRKRFLETLAITSNVARAAEVSKVGLGRAYETRRAEPDFARAWQAAIADGYLNLEMEVSAACAKVTSSPPTATGSTSPMRYACLPPTATAPRAARAKSAMSASPRCGLRLTARSTRSAGAWNGRTQPGRSRNERTLRLDAEPEAQSARPGEGRTIGQVEPDRAERLRVPLGLQGAQGTAPAAWRLAHLDDHGWARLRKDALGRGVGTDDCRCESRCPHRARLLLAGRSASGYGRRGERPAGDLSPESTPAL